MRYVIQPSLSRKNSDTNFKFQLRVQPECVIVRPCSALSQLIVCTVGCNPPMYFIVLIMLLM